MTFKQKIERLRTFKILFKNNNEKLELLNSFHKLIFNHQSAVSPKVPPGARGPRTPLLRHWAKILSTNTPIHAIAVLSRILGSESDALI